MPEARETKPSAPAEVDAYVAKLKHPLVPVAQELRKHILKADTRIGEEIKWNSPTFYYTGPLAPSNPKEFRRYLLVMNLYKSDCLRLVFMHAADADDGSGFLQGDYADGRRLAYFRDLREVAAGKDELRKVLRALVRAIGSGA